MGVLVSFRDLFWQPFQPHHHNHTSVGSLQPAGLISCREKILIPGMPLRLLQRLLVCFSMALALPPSFSKSDGAETNTLDQLKPQQAITRGTPPKSPAVFDPDPNKLVI